MIVNAPLECDNQLALTGGAPLCGENNGARFRRSSFRPLSPNPRAHCAATEAALRRAPLGATMAALVGRQVQLSTWVVKISCLKLRPVTYRGSPLQASPALSDISPQRFGPKRMPCRCLVLPRRGSISLCQSGTIRSTLYSVTSYGVKPKYCPASKLFRNVPFLTSLEVSPFWFLFLRLFLSLALPAAKPCEPGGRAVRAERRARPTTVAAQIAEDASADCP